MVAAAVDIALPTSFSQLNDCNGGGVSESRPQDSIRPCQKDFSRHIDGQLIQIDDYFHYHEYGVNRPSEAPGLLASVLLASRLCRCISS